ncbi:MAG: hypothetical protein RIR63_536 [Actinomycetota bacterium]
MGFHLNSSRRAVAIWTTVAAFLGFAILQPSAYGLEFSATTTLTLPASDQLDALTGEVFLTSMTDPEIAPIEAALFSELSSSATVSASAMSLVSSASASVELARDPDGAREVAKSLMEEKYGWGNKQYACLDDLWIKESNWNYRASNKRTGAHGIPQALPATKMDSAGTDWRTNPVTQISWGLRYIDVRYDTPCKAWAKFKRSNWY